MRISHGRSDDACSRHGAGTTRRRRRDRIARLGERTGARALVASTRTNADGRTDAPLIAAADARAGVFELSFHVGDYFRGSRRERSPSRRFSTSCPIRFADRRSGRALSRAAGRDAVELFDLSRELKARPAAGIFQARLQLP